MGVDSMQLSHHPHLAWVASNANISNLPSPTIPECNGHGWVMGEGSGAHCMCDDGYQWDGDDRMTCVSGDGQGTHSETAQDTYDVGHSTVTFILDKEGKKRVAWVGSDWSADEFLEDILALI
jgi:hypothetical protein